MTIELVIISFVIGVTFGGMGFKVIIVVPAVLLGMLLAVMAGLAHADHLRFIITTMILVGTAIQIGYLTGLLIRAWLMSMHRH